MSGISLIELGRVDEGLAHIEREVALSHRHHWALQDLAGAFRASGKVRESDALCDEIVERAQTGYVPPGIVAMALNFANRPDQATEWLERAYRERDCLPVWNYWPSSMTARGNGSRIAEMMRRVGLEPNPRLAR